MGGLASLYEELEPLQLLAQAFQAASYGDIPGAFIANALAVPLRSLGTQATEAAFAVLWWAHIVLVAAFLVYLPYSKHLHVATAPFNVYFRKLALSSFSFSA